MARQLFAPRLAFARAARDKRLVFIIQRGAANGLSTIGLLGRFRLRGGARRLCREFRDWRKARQLIPAAPESGDRRRALRQGQARSSTQWHHPIAIDRVSTDKM